THSSRLFDRMNVPSHLTAVSMDSLSVFGIGLEIHDGPGCVFEECEINDGIKHTGEIILDQNRKFTMAPAGLACPDEQRMLEGRSHSLRAAADFCVGGVQQSCVCRNKAKNGFRWGGEINIPQN